jgi:dTDP-4-dehydrorhamnose reductase
VKVFVLGHRGMLGHVVARYLAQRGHEVSSSDLRYTGAPRDPLVEAVRGSGCAWIVNALGAIHQKAPSPAQLYLANARFPVHLAARMAPGQRLLHASTDCVFSGRRGGYRVGDERDAEDPYGFSKLLGEAAAEAPRCIALRTSVIGPGSPHGLMGWFLDQREPVQGFRNHRWNGMTSLEWAKLCAELLEGRTQPQRAIVHAGSVQALSKYELLKLIAASWPGCAEVRPVDAPQRVDRTLELDLLRAPLAEQLRELRAW